jgi:hypothetical protein
MKRMKIILLMAILTILSTFAIGIAAESVLMKNQENNISNIISQPILFYAEITFTVVVNDGCGCNPIEGALIKAYGGSGYNEGITDENGTLILQLEINAEYRVDITSEGFRSILFDFDIIDDQYFVFQMVKRGTSSQTFNFYQSYLLNLLNTKI